MTQESSPAILELGPASGPPDPAAARRRQGLSRWLARPRRCLTGARPDTRVIPVIAALGAAAAFASLITDWQKTTIGISVGESFVDSGEPAVVAGFPDLGTWGTGYLIGLFGLTAAVGLVLFGAPAVRRHARLAGIGAGSTLFALLVAATIDIADKPVGIPSYAFLGENRVRFDSSYGPGPYLATAGVAALGLALFLAERLPAPAGTVESTQRIVPGDNGTPDGEGALVSWRRPVTATADPDEPAPPADLTVTPATPFVHVPES